MELACVDVSVSLILLFQSNESLVATGGFSTLKTGPRLWTHQTWNQHLDLKAYMRSSKFQAIIMSTEICAYTLNVCISCQLIWNVLVQISAEQFTGLEANISWQRYFSSWSKPTFSWLLKDVYNLWVT